ncbi:MAG: anti-sigma factor domain-containing protein [Candidatus Dormibacteria bacterium]
MATELTCTESEELLALAALGVLTRAEGEPLDVHLRGCMRCRRAATAYLQAVATLPSSLDLVEPPPTLRRNLMRQVYGETSQVPAESRRKSVLRALTLRRLLPVGGAVVTLAAVFVAIVAVSTRPSTSSDPSRTYTVVGTTSAPGLQGTLSYDPGAQQAVMTLTGLPQPTAAVGATPDVYEVWLVRASGAAEGVAFLTQSPLTHAWTTVIHTDLSQYVAIAATAEPYGGSLQPTSPQLLSAQLTR